MITKRFASVLIALSLASVAALAHAQYAWIDEKGVKQFSDMPPPPHIAQDRILKQPRGTVQGVASGSTGNTQPSSSQTDKSNVPLTTAEKNAEFNKRRMEQAEKEKKAAEKIAFDSAKAKNCERARSYGATLSSGQRIAQTNSSGERVFMSDEQRARELQEAQSILADCK